MSCSFFDAFELVGVTWIMIGNLDFKAPFYLSIMKTGNLTGTSDSVQIQIVATFQLRIV